MIARYLCDGSVQVRLGRVRRCIAAVQYARLSVHFQLIPNGNLSYCFGNMRSKVQVVSRPPSRTLLARDFNIDRAVESSEHNILQPATGFGDIVKISFVI